MLMSPLAAGDDDDDHVHDCHGAAVAALRFAAATAVTVLHWYRSVAAPPVVQPPREVVPFGS